MYRSTLVGTTFEFITAEPPLGKVLYQVERDGLIWLFDDKDSAELCRAAQCGPAWDYTDAVACTFDLETGAHSWVNCCLAVSRAGD